MHSTTWLNCFNWLHKKNQLSTTNLCEVNVSSYTSAVTLASGDSQKSLGWAHRIRNATRISKLIRETTNAIWKVLKEVYLNPPQEVAVWKIISKELKIFGTFHIVSRLLTENMLPLNALIYLGASTLITKVYLVWY